MGVGSGAGQSSKIQSRAKLFALIGHDIQSSQLPMMYVLSTIPGRRTMIQSASITLVTPALMETKAFYEHHFCAMPTFNCGWYVVLTIPDSSVEICLMEPMDGSVHFTGGVVMNWRVENVDALHQKMVANQVNIIIPLADHPWGDRGFGIIDPAGATVYCYEEIAPAPEFKQFFIG